MDFQYFLPLFFEGLVERRDPTRFLARAGTLELLEYVETRSLAQILPSIMPHITAALETKTSRHWT